MVSYGYYVFGKDMNNINLKTLQNKGVSDLFLNYYSFQVYGESKVKSFIKSCTEYNINVHIWVQTYYDGKWHNPKTTNMNSKIDEIKKYSRINNVKGIHLDYLRYPGDAYKTSGGADSITNFVKKVKSILPKNIILSCALMPEKDGKKYYGQDIEALGKIVDIVIPMQYKGNYNSGTEWLQSTTEYFTKYANVWSALQTYKSDTNPTLLSSNELLKDIQTCTSKGSKGVILFRYGLTSSIDFNTLNKSKSNKTRNVGKVTVLKLAKNVKEYVETKHKFPVTVTVNNKKYSYSELAYIFSYNMNNMGKTIKYQENSIMNNSSSSNNSFKENILENDYKDIGKRIYEYIEKNNVCPNYASTMKSKKKLRPRDYIYMMARVIVYYYNNKNTYPKYATVDTRIF